MHPQNYLLDSHALLWFQGNHSNLSSNVKKIIEDTRNNNFVSQISLYEIVIKQSIGKLPDFSSTVSQIYHQLVEDEMRFLPLNNNHLEAYNKIPLMASHHDPFDRLLLATAFQENAVILSTDKNFDLYQSLVTTIW